MFGFWHRLLLALLFVAPITDADLTTSSNHITDNINTTTSTTTVTSKVTPPNSTEIASTDLPEPLPTLAAKLVRHRRQPWTVVRHIYHTSRHSKPRRRVKRPKLRYGPPNYSYGPPLTYYKPKPLPQPSEPEHPSLSVDELSHYNLNAADFELPSNSYEGQTMDLDLYSHSEGSYKTSHIPEQEYTTFDVAPEEPSYSYGPSKPEESSFYKPSKGYSSYDLVPEIPSYKPTKSAAKAPRKPHVKYGVPEPYGEPIGDYKEPSSVGHYDIQSVFVESDYSAPQSHEPHPAPEYEAPSPSYTEYHPPSNSYEAKPADSYGPPKSEIHIPATKYGVPDPQIPLHYPPSSSSSSDDTYSTFSKKIPNTSYGSSASDHHFAEPPSNIEITYSPSYEITLPPKRKPVEPQYSPPSEGNFAEPPPSYKPQPPELTYHPEPAHPSNSHDPIYTEHPKQTASDDQSHIPVYSAHPPAPPSDTPPHPAYPGHAEDYVPPSQELPLNPNHMQPAYDYPKSSYEVPIYDPIPFEASNTNEQEFYPPHSGRPNVGPPDDEPQEPPGKGNTEPNSEHDDNTSSEEQGSEDARPSGTTTTTGQRVVRHRQRLQPGIAKVSSKHILDVPELEQAFEVHNRNRYRTSLHKDAVVNESSNVEKQNNTPLLPTIPPNTGNENYASHAWNPMRIRSSTHLLKSPTTTVATEPKPTPDTERPRYRNQSRTPQRRPMRPIQAIVNASSSTTRQKKPNVAVVSIEKSHSQSFYDGTLPPPTQTTTNRYQTRSNRLRTSSRLPPAGHSQTGNTDTSRRTTKSVFDTTYFKSPRNDKTLESKIKEFEQILPKNHKLF